MIQPTVRRTTRGGAGLVSIFALLSTSLLVANVYLQYRNRHLLSALNIRASALAPKAGMVVPPLNGLTPAGTAISLAYGGEDRRPTLLFAFSTECPFCEIAWPRWKRVPRYLGKTEYRFVYVNLSNGIAEGYLKAHDIPPEDVVIAAVDPRTKAAYNLSLTPAVLLIDRSAQIRNVWLGADESGYRDMAQVLGVAPGLFLRDRPDVKR